MGGFGAVKLALRHPDLFAFVGGMSSAIDVPRRAFTIKRLQQSRHYNSIFGSSGSRTRRDNDPFMLAQSANAESAPYFFLTCGEQEGLLPSNRDFAGLLDRRHFRFEFHTVPGGHDWNQWNAWLPTLFTSLAEHMSPSTLKSAASDPAWRGGIAGGIGIKVGNMVPACCECNPGGSIADVLSRSASRFEVGPRLGPSAAVRNPRPAAGGE